MVSSHGLPRTVAEGCTQADEVVSSHGLPRTVADGCTQGEREKRKYAEGGKKQGAVCLLIRKKYVSLHMFRQVGWQDSTDYSN